MRHPARLAWLLALILPSMCFAQERLQAFAQVPLSELPDGSGFVCGQGNVVAVWKFGKSQPEALYKLPKSVWFGGHEGSISPDGRFAFVTVDRVGELLDLRSGKALWSGLEVAGAKATFSNDDRLVAIRSDTTTIRDMQTGRVMFGIGSDGVSAAFSPDSSRVAVAGYGGSFEWWDIETGLPIAHKNTPAMEGVGAMEFSPDGKHLLTTIFGYVQEWDVQSGVCEATLSTETNNIFDEAVIGYLPNGRPVATNYRLCQMQVWDVRSGKILCGPLPHARWTEGAVFAPKSGMLLTDSEGTHAWSLPSGKFAGNYGNRNLYGDVHDSLDGRRSWYGDPDGLMVDFKTGQIIRRTLLERFTEYHLSPNLTSMVALSWADKQGLVVFIDTRTGRRRTFPTSAGFYVVAACADDGSWALLANPYGGHNVSFAVVSGLTGKVVTTFARNVDANGGMDHSISSRGNLVNLSTFEVVPGKQWVPHQEVMAMPSGKTIKISDRDLVDNSIKKPTRVGMKIERPDDWPGTAIGEVLPLERGWAFWDGEGNYDASSMADVENVLVTTPDGGFQRLATLHRVPGLLRKRLKQLHWRG